MKCVQTLVEPVYDMFFETHIRAREWKKLLCSLEDPVFAR